MVRDIALPKSETRRMSDQNIQGTCLCGTVTYRITGRILSFQYCHCSRCRKFTGSAHAANVFTALDGLEWVQGEDSVGQVRFRCQPEVRHRVLQKLRLVTTKRLELCGCLGDPCRLA